MLTISVWTEDVVASVIAFCTQCRDELRSKHLIFEKKVANLLQLWTWRG